MRVLAAILAVTAGLGAQTSDLAPETVLMGNFLSRMREHMTRQPNYTCVETVERTRQPAGGGSQVEDTLRLEVALVGEKEMFAWPGSKEFIDAKPLELVSTGMFGNGNFALFSRILFGGAGPAFRFSGDEAIGGRMVVRYDFRVPLAASRYQWTVGEHEAYVGYHGSAYIDRETLDLRRLHIIADDIPAILGVTEAEDRVDYGRVRIGGEDFLLPVESALMMASPAGVNRNRTRFTSCRKFTGQSELVFLDPDFITEVAAPPEVAEIELPAGLQAGLVLETRIDLNEGFAGDALEARLNADVKRDGLVLAPKGAVARGRIVRLERWEHFYLLGIRWTDLEWSRGHARLNLKFERMGLSLPGQPAIHEASGDLQIPRPGIRSLHNVLTFWSTLE